MEAGTRVFSDAKQCSPSGCKKLGKHGSRKGAVRRSAHLITDYKGDEYERVEYTPYGEYWIEKRAPENRTLPFKFTGKERDEETGLYYYGARYLDAKTSRWLTTDPALGEYIPMAPVNDEAKKHNQNLPGMGGIYNTVNMHLYHYAGNNPIKYTDPTGMFDWETNTIEAGDTLSKITDEFNRKNDTNYTYDDMAKANGIEDPNKIYAGNKLDFSSLLPSNIALESITDSQNIDTVPDAGYPKELNVLIGSAEIVLGIGIIIETSKAAAAIEVVSAGTAGYYAALAVVEGWAAGSAFVAFGISRLAGLNNSKVENDIKTVFTPNEADIANIINENAKRGKKQ